MGTGPFAAWSLFESDTSSSHRLFEIFQDGSILALSPMMNFYNGYVAGYFICAS